MSSAHHWLGSVQHHTPVVLLAAILRRERKEGDVMD